MKTAALIGPTASGKSDLALAIAQRHGCLLLSLDSLAIYKKIDIASAKPSKEELALVPHYGIDVLEPDEPFHVVRFFDLYKEAAEAAEKAGKNLLIVGGTGFYLKALTDGLSEVPPPSPETKEKVKTMMADLPAAHAALCAADPEFAGVVHPSDGYRTEKALEVWLETGEPPIRFRKENMQEPLLPDLPIFEIDLPPETLRERIRLRTRKMVEAGLIDEIAGLEREYGRAPRSMGAIGIKEVLDYFDGKWDREEMEERIALHTGQLAKRQRTFNRGQFAPAARGTVPELEEPLDRFFGEG